MCHVTLVGRYQDFGRIRCCQFPARKALFFPEDLGSVFHENDGTVPLYQAIWHVNLALATM